MTAFDDGQRWIKRWERKFLSGLYRAQHEHDVEQARQYAELRKPLPERMRPALSRPHRQEVS